MPDNTPEYSEKKFKGLLGELKNYDIYIIVDDSTSSKDYWPKLKDALYDLTEFAFEYDTDGLDICFLSEAGKTHNVKTSRGITTLLKHRGPTFGRRPMADVLEKLISKYRSALEDNSKVVKRRSFMVLSAGAPTDSPEELISDTVKWLANHNYPFGQLGLQFVQIGNDASARNAFRKLDNLLKGNPRDFVDTTLYTIEYSEDSDEKKASKRVLLKAFLGGINRKWDKYDD